MDELEIYFAGKYYHSNFGGAQHTDFPKLASYLMILDRYRLVLCLISIGFI